MSFVQENLAGRIDFRAFYDSEGVQFRGRRNRALCPFHDDHRPSFDVDLQTGLYICRSCGAGGDPVSFLVRLRGIGEAEAIAELKRRYGVNGGPPPLESVRRATGTKTYEICDAGGRLVAFHRRTNFDDGSKSFAWALSDGSQGLGGLPVAELPLYLSETLGLRNGLVIVTEGEKAADCLAEHGFLVVATTGASVTPCAGSLEVLSDRDVVLWPDKDEPGRAHMLRVTGALAGIAASVRVISWGEQKGDDAADFFERGGTAEQLDRLLADARPPEQPETTSSSTAATEEKRTADRPKLVRLADVQPEEVSWLWRGRIPFGKLTVFDGDPGLGKSTVMLDLAARLTTGRTLPDGCSCDPASVILLSAEDGLADTIRPRLDAAAADTSRVQALPVVLSANGAELFPQLDQHLAAIEAGVREVSARLLIVDPLMAYLGPCVNSYRDQDVRGVLAPLAALAERTGAAVVLIRHLRKSQRAEGALYAGGGSIGIAGAARSVLLAVKDADDPSRRIIAATKSNLCQPPLALAYRLEADQQGRAWVDWEPEPFALTADQLLAAASEPEEDRTARADAKDWLGYFLADGPHSAVEVQRDAKRAGHAWRTVRRAADELGVKRTKTGFKAGWVYSLSDLEDGQATPKVPIS